MNQTISLVNRGFAFLLPLCSSFYVFFFCSSPFLFLSLGFAFHLGSLLSLLKKKRYANALSAGKSHSNSHFCFFAVSVDLTPEGYQSIDEIVVLIFQYIHLLTTVNEQGFLCSFVVFSSCTNVHVVVAHETEAGV